jgi:hypothetical protein
VGQRLKQAHDQRHQQIWIRRAVAHATRPLRCCPTGRPSGRHLVAICSRRRRRNAIARPIYGETVGRTLAASANAADDMFWRAMGWGIWISPTTLAWDWTAIRRILLLGASRP